MTKTATYKFNFNAMKKISAKIFLKWNIRLVQLLMSPRKISLKEVTGKNFVTNKNIVWMIRKKRFQKQTTVNSKKSWKGKSMKLSYFMEKNTLLKAMI